MSNDTDRRMDRVVSLVAIRQLATRYAVAFAALDLDALVELFAPDVRVGDQHGREALRAQLEGAMRAADPAGAVRSAVLQVGTHVVDLDLAGEPDRASGTVYSHGQMQRGDGSWFHQAICYGDTYVRRDGAWYFWRRRHELFYGVESGRSPIGLEPADWPRHDVGKGTLPERWASWQAFQSSGHP